MENFLAGMVVGIFLVLAFFWFFIQKILASIVKPKSSEDDWWKKGQDDDWWKKGQDDSYPT